jgi:hypothetical protein
MSRRVTECSEVKVITTGAAGKPSPNRAIQLYLVDPKLGDLPMVRVKCREVGMEARTDVCCKKLG